MLFDLKRKLFSLNGTHVVDLETAAEVTAAQILASLIANYSHPTPNAGWLHKKAVKLFETGELDISREDLQVVTDLVNQAPSLSLSVRAQLLGLLDPAQFDK